METLQMRLRQAQTNEQREAIKNDIAEQVAICYKANEFEIDEIKQGIYFSIKVGAGMLHSLLFRCLQWHSHNVSYFVHYSNVYKTFFIHVTFIR